MTHTYTYTTRIVISKKKWTLFIKRAILVVLKTDNCLQINIASPTTMHANIVSYLVIYISWTNSHPCNAPTKSHMENYILSQMLDSSHKM